MSIGEVAEGEIIANLVAKWYSLRACALKRRRHVLTMRNACLSLVALRGNGVAEESAGVYARSIGQGIIVANIFLRAIVKRNAETRRRDDLALAACFCRCSLDISRPGDVGAAQMRMPSAWATSACRP